MLVAAILVLVGFILFLSFKASSRDFAIRNCVADYLGQQEAYLIRIRVSARNHGSNPFAKEQFFTPKIYQFGKHKQIRYYYRFVQYLDHAGNEKEAFAQLRKTGPSSYNIKMAPSIDAPYKGKNNRKLAD